MVQNNQVHPYSGIGKLMTEFQNPITKVTLIVKGTAFIISKSHIMTAYHNVNNKHFNLKNIKFYPEPLSSTKPLKNPIEA